jgi:hypothetical protein
MKDRGVDPDRFQLFLDVIPQGARHLLVSLIETGPGALIVPDPDAPPSLKHLLSDSRMTPDEKARWEAERPKKEPGPGRPTRPRKRR